MKIYFVAFLVVVSTLLVLNVCGDDMHERQKRGAENYEDSYNQFMKTHFGRADVKHLDKSSDYKLAKQQYAGDDETSSHEDEEDRDSESEGKKKAESDDDDYGIDHSWFYQKGSGKDDYERIKALSEAQVAELRKNPENCKHYEKDGMICAICEDPETGDSSESCAFSSEPTDKKVAYLSRKMHNYKKPQPAEVEDPENTEDEADEEEEAAVNPPPKGPKPLKHKTESEDSDYGAYKIAETNDDVDDYDEPKKFAHLKAEPSSTTEKYTHDFEIIPEAKPNSFKSKNLNQALTNFKAKDWTKCQKILKGDLTCYYCKDAKGATQEECMFISASNPKNFKIEHHESKNYDHNSRKPHPTKQPLARLSATIESTTPTFPTTKDELTEKKERFARLRNGRPLMPTKPSFKSTAEPLVTPKTSLNPNNQEEFINTENKKAIKRTISFRKKYFDSDPFQPAESRAIKFMSFVKHY